MVGVVKQQLSQLDGCYKSTVKSEFAPQKTQVAPPSSGCSVRTITISFSSFRAAGPGCCAPDPATGQCRSEVANQGRYEAPTPEQLLGEQLGWSLPVSHLVWWVRGLPAPGSKSRVTLNADSRLANLEQDGWKIEYLSYVEQNGFWLPERLKLYVGSGRHISG